MVGTGHSNYSNHPIMTICHPTNNNNNNNNNFEEKTLDMGNSQMENRLRLQLLITHMILAEKEHKKLELEVTRLARLLAADQGSSLFLCYFSPFNSLISPISPMFMFIYTLLIEYQNRNRNTEITKNIMLCFLLLYCSCIFSQRNFCLSS